MKNQPKVTVIDAPCGQGKTSYAIQMMNDFSKVGFGTHSKIYESEKKFIYVTPFLDEVERIIDSTKAEYCEPNNLRGSKSKHVKKLVEDEKNIVMTHELFSMMDEETLAHIEMQDYTLIMDEVANVIEQYPINKSDIDLLITGGAIEIVEDNKVRWIKEDYEINDISAHKGVRILAEKDNLYLENNTAMFWTMDIKSFTSFKEIFILTYYFDGQTQKYYYEMHDLEHTKVSVKKVNDRYELTEYDKSLEPRAHIKSLLNIYEDGKSATGRPSELNTNYNHNRRKDSNYWLSSTWFKNATPEEIDQLKKNLNSYFKSQVPTANNELFWTTVKDVAPKIKDKKCILNKKDDRTKDNFLAFNVRATNNYGNRTATAFVYNRFMNPMEKKFFENRGIEVNEDALALSDLIQFLFRGCIRNNEEMSCYIPSPRMRGLLYDWMEFKI